MLHTRAQAKEPTVFNARELGDNEKHDDKLILKICDINHQQLPLSMRRTEEETEKETFFPFMMFEKSRGKEGKTNSLIRK